MRLRTLVALSLSILLGVLTSLHVNAQSPTPQISPRPAASPTPSTEPTPQPPTSPAPKVTNLTGNLELDDLIVVEVENLEAWAARNDPTKLVPYLDGRSIDGNYPEAIHTDKNRLHFHLQITPANKKRWTDLLGAPSGTRRPVTFSVGFENQSPFDSVYEQGHEVALTVISPFYGVVALFVVLSTLVLFLWLARKTNLIREPGAHPDGGKLPPYNLGRTQMAFWFFLIYVSYLVIWLITGALDTITASLLALMGISAGTALGEAIIDSGKDATRTDQLQQLAAEKQSLEPTVSDQQAQLNGLMSKPALTLEETSNRVSLNQQLQDSRTRLAKINQEAQALTRPAAAEESRGFIRDILSDSSGYSFHRFQIFAWTIVLGIMFVSSVYNGLTMPEFSPTLLGLMGLSSGTYIGFKFPEKK